MESNAITAWEATAVDGAELNSHTAGTFERVNDRGGARSVRFWVGDRVYHVACIPEHGESIHLFTRRGILNAGTEAALQVNMPVAELRRADGTFARLYVHPDHGVIVSTLDLNL